MRSVIFLWQRRSPSPTPPLRLTGFQNGYRISSHSSTWLGLVLTTSNRLENILLKEIAKYTSNCCNNKQTKREVITISYLAARVMPRSINGKWWDPLSLSKWWDPLSLKKQWDPLSLSRWWDPLSLSEWWDPSHLYLKLKVRQCTFTWLYQGQEELSSKNEPHYEGTVISTFTPSFVNG